MKPFMIFCFFVSLIPFLLPSQTSPLQTNNDVGFQSFLASGSMLPHAVKKRNLENEELEVSFDWQPFHTNESLVLEIFNKFPAHVTFRCCGELLLESVSPIVNSSMSLGPFWVQYFRELVYEKRCSQDNNLIMIATPANQPSISFEVTFNLTRFKGCLASQRANSEFEEVNIRQDANRVGMYNVKIAGIITKALTHKTTEQMVISYGFGRPISLRFTKCNLLIKEIITFNANEHYEVDENLLNKIRMLDQTVCGTESIDSGLVLPTYPGNNTSIFRISAMVISDHRLVTTLKFYMQSVTHTTQPPETTTTEASGIINVEEPGMIRFLNWVGKGKVVIDLRHILNTTLNFMIMLDIYSSEPITFSLEKQHREIIGRSIPFKEERFHFAGSWIHYFTNLSRVVTTGEVHNFTLIFSTGKKKATGNFRFGKTKWIKIQDARKVNTDGIIHIHQDSINPVSYYPALGNIIEKAVQNQSLTRRLNSYLSETINIGIGKCETNTVVTRLNETDSLSIGEDLLDHMDRMNNLFCTSDRNLGRFDLTVFSANPVNNTLRFEFDGPIDDKESGPFYTYIAGIIFGLLAVAGVCFFLVQCRRRRVQRILREKNAVMELENIRLINLFNAMDNSEEVANIQSSSESYSDITEQLDAIDRVRYRLGRLEETRMPHDTDTVRFSQESQPCTSVWVVNDSFGKRNTVSVSRSTINDFNHRFNRLPPPPPPLSEDKEAHDDDTCPFTNFSHEQREANGTKKRKRKKAV
ncbi:hypothetical protein CRE_05149 [Caenorhabditis remanei]|uniref:Peptidase S72 domain-containing protein n=1 Tax=Caenorhabditis remanei TaxID=31234 RepID=E3N6B8_CAERE|nr:hypothetical protein CRE_05149 [Caenorhabditis remanei]